MKYEKAWKTIIGVCVLVLMLALPAGAQTRRSGEAQGQATGGISPLSLDQGVLGKDILTREGEDIGAVDDVIFSRRGRIAHYLVDVGRFLGTGEKIVALNPDQVEFTDKDQAIFNGTRADLENMPRLDPYSWGFYHGYYGSGQGAYSRPYPGTYGGGYGGGGYDQGYGYWREEQSNQQPYPGRRYYRRGPGMMRQGPPGRGISSDVFMDNRVVDPQYRTIGEVEDLLMDPQRHRITEVVVGVRGKKVLVPFNQLRLVGQNSVMYRGTEEQLERMPEFRMGQGGRVIGGGIPEKKAGGSPPIQPRGQEKPEQQ